jgi:hypothetical protein
MRPGECGDRPRKAPAVAVEHRQGPQIDRMMPHAPDENIAERIQTGAAMVIDDTLRVPGGAGSVVGRKPPIPKWTGAVLLPTAHGRCGFG